MELDPCFGEKLSMNFPKTPSIKSEMVPSSVVSPPPPPPSHYTTFLYQNHHFKKHHPLNNHPGFATRVPSSSSMISMIPTPSYQRDFVDARNPMTFEPNMELPTMHGRLNSSKGIWDLSNDKNNLFQSQVGVGPTLSAPSLLYGDGAIKPKLQGGDSSCTHGRIGNKPRVNDRGRIQMNSEIQHKDPNKIKGQWTTNEDRYMNFFFFTTMNISN